MSRELHDDDELRVAIRRGRPPRGLETAGCVGVLICMALGGLAGAFAFDWVIGEENGVNGRLRTRASLLIPAGVMAGLTVGVLTYRALCMMSRKSPPRGIDVPDPPHFDPGVTP